MIPGTYCFSSLRDIRSQPALPNGPSRYHSSAGCKGKPQSEHMITISLKFMRISHLLRAGITNILKVHSELFPVYNVQCMPVVYNQTECALKLPCCSEAEATGRAQKENITQASLQSIPTKHCDIKIMLYYIFKLSYMIVGRFLLKLVVPVYSLTNQCARYIKLKVTLATTLMLHTMLPFYA